MDPYIIHQNIKAPVQISEDIQTITGLVMNMPPKPMKMSTLGGFTFSLPQK
jgi:hypothetical protein